jgi:DNA-binding NarL/FixJ family response regulator
VEKGEDVRILLADDHPLFLDGLKNLLTIRGLEVVGTAHDGFEALEKARALKPEVILMDIQMPRLNGLAATRLSKTDKFFELLSGLMRGEVPLSSGLAGRVLEEFARQGGAVGSVEQPAEKEKALSPRQMEVLTLVAQGLTYKEIGAKLFLAEATIKYHMGEIIERLHLENRRQVIEYARRMKLGKK